MGDTLQQAIDSFTKKFLSFQIDTMQGEAENLLTAGISVQGFLQACMPCMEQVGKKFEAGEYYLPQLVVAGEMFKNVSDRIKSSLAVEEPPSIYGDIVLGTPKGDLHDLGKDIFAVLAEASGFTVHNLGVDVEPEVFVEKLTQTGATILGLSTLLTTAFESVKDLVVLLEKHGLRQKTFVILGGGATEPSLIQKMGIDAQTRDAYEGVTQIRRFTEAGKMEGTV